MCYGYSGIGYVSITPEVGAPTSYTDPSGMTMTWDPMTGQYIETVVVTAKSLAGSGDAYIAASAYFAGDGVAGGGGTIALDLNTGQIFVAPGAGAGAAVTIGVTSDLKGTISGLQAGIDLGPISVDPTSLMSGGESSLSTGSGGLGADIAINAPATSFGKAY